MKSFMPHTFRLDKENILVSADCFYAVPRLNFSNWKVQCTKNPELNV